MKFIFGLVCVLILFANRAIGQYDFAPVGAEWYYDSMDSGMAPPHSEYFLYQSVKDTMVTNTSCRKITINKFAYTNTIISYPPLFVYGDTSEVFYFNNQHNKFVSLYKFNVAIGDTLTYYTLPSLFVTDSLFKVVVDTIYYKLISSTQVKFIYTNPITEMSDYTFSYWGSYCCFIGGLNMMLPQQTPNIPEMDGPLRCYLDSNLSFNNNWSLACDYREIFNSIEDDQLVAPFSVFNISPNPTSTTITLSLPSNQNVILSIFNLLGEKVKEEKVTGKQVTIDVSSLPQGWYLVRMENRVLGKPTFVNTTVGKFVKE